MNEVTIIGTGPAGLTAAIYTARAGLNPVVYAGLQHGGQLTTTTDVENFPGFSEPVMGPKLMEEMTDQALRVGAKIEYEEVTKSDLTASPFTLWLGDKKIQTKTLIIATGATARWLGLEGEDKLMGRGISTCATCDGFFYKGKDVAVIGGGDSAMEEASYLANLCNSVTLIHRRDHFRASEIMLNRVKKNPKITMKVPYNTLEAVSDASGLTGVVIENAETKEKETLNIHGLFYAIGHTPNSKVFSDYLDTDEHGYILTKEHTATKVPGVFSAGDISDSFFRQAVTAAGMGCQAAIQAQRYLEDQES